MYLYPALTGEELVAKARALAAARDPQLLISINSARDPGRLGSDTYTRGGVLARAYLYDPMTRRITCIGDVASTSSRIIEVWGNDAEPVAEDVEAKSDLYVHLIEDARRSLRAVRAPAGT